MKIDKLKVADHLEGYERQRVQADIDAAYILVKDMMTNPQNWTQDHYHFTNGSVKFWVANDKPFFKTDDKSSLQLPNDICQKYIWRYYSKWKANQTQIWINKNTPKKPILNRLKDWYRTKIYRKEVPLLEYKPEKTVKEIK